MYLDQLINRLRDLEAEHGNSLEVHSGAACGDEIDEVFFDEKAGYVYVC